MFRKPSKRGDSFASVVSPLSSSDMTMKKSNKATTLSAASTRSFASSVLESPTAVSMIAMRIDKSLQYEIDQRNQRMKESNSQTCRSNDIPLLQKEFEKMKYNLRRLIVSATKYHEHITELNKYRSEVAEEIASLSLCSPIETQITTTSNANKNESFLSIYKSANLQSNKDTMKYQKDVLEYAIEWERIVVSRIDAEIKKSNELLSTKLHYAEKLVQLRKKLSDIETSKKPPPINMIERLQRNEEKYQQAETAYSDCAFVLDSLLEETVICCWKDLYTMLVSLMSYESDRASTENAIFAKLTSNVLKEVTTIFNQVKDYKAVRLEEKNDRDTNDNNHDKVNDE